MGNRIVLNIALVALVLGTAGFLVSQWQVKTQPPSPYEQESKAVDLGISYLPVTPSVSKYFNLAVDTGALVTEIVPEGIAEQAGVQVGDVIVAFNENSLKEVTLFRLISDHDTSDKVTLVIYRGEEIIHIILGPCDR